MKSAIVLAKNLRKLREMHGYTLKQVGASIGVTLTTVHRYERIGKGFTWPGFEVVDKLADLYRVSIADLFTPDASAKKAMEIAGQSTLENALHVVNLHFADLVLKKKKKV